MIVQILGTYLGKLILTAGMAILPIVELRGAIPFGASLGLPCRPLFLRV